MPDVFVLDVQYCLIKVLLFICFELFVTAL
jgi:hypothetical protein